MCVCVHMCVYKMEVLECKVYLLPQIVNKKFENVALHNTRKAFHVILPHKRRTQSFATKAR